MSDENSDMQKSLRSESQVLMARGFSVLGKWTKSRLEHRWNEALQRVQDAETHRAALAQGPGPLREEQRQQLLSLSQALSAVWRHTAAPEALKKRLLRTVLSEIMIDSTPEPAEYLLRLHWHGGVHTE
jgi:hypothetical protein